MKLYVHVLSKPAIPPLQIFPEENTLCSYSMWYHLQRANYWKPKCPLKKTIWTNHELHPSMEYYAATQKWASKEEWSLSVDMKWFSGPALKWKMPSTKASIENIFCVRKMKLKYVYRNSISGHMPKRIKNKCSNKNWYTKLHISAVHSNWKKRKQPKWPIN